MLLYTVRSWSFAGLIMVWFGHGLACPFADNGLYELAMVCAGLTMGHIWTGHGLCCDLLTVGCSGHGPG